MMPVAPLWTPENCTHDTGDCDYEFCPPPLDDDEDDPEDDDEDDPDIGYAYDIDQF
jgi:hypothetical protein